MAIAPWAARGAFGGGLLDPFFGGAGGDLGALMAPFGGGAGAIQTMPPMDVHETEKTYEIRADAPGMNPEDITVDVDQNTLTIRGEHRDVVRDTDTAGRVIRTERSRRSFTRSFNLPLGADPDNVKASLDRGVLNVSIQKKPEEQGKSKRIPIAAGGGAAPATVTGGGGGSAGAAGGGTTPQRAGGAQRET